MKILVRHRDEGSRKLMERLSASVPELEFLDSMPSGPIGPLTGIDAVIAIGPVPREPLEQGAFGFIQTVGTGYEHVDLAAATELGVHVSNMPASQTGNAESVAEHAILLMLALARQLDAAREALRDGRWAQPPGLALLDKTACLIGLGDVGVALANRLHAFGMHIVATRRDPSKPKPDYVRVFPSPALPHIIEAADYVILCARPAADNRNLIDTPLLTRMKRGAVLINIARGSLVNHDALLTALRSGTLRGAGLDVFWDEPVDPDHPLFAQPNLIATPHVAGVTDVNLNRTLLLLGANLRRYARGETPLFAVNNPTTNRASPSPQSR